MCFSKMKPSSWDESFPLIQQFFRDSPEKFIVISPLHQNDASDMLHFSVEFRLQFTTYRFHIYGYYKNLFVIQKITMTNNFMNVWSDVKMLAQFTN